MRFFGMCAAISITVASLTVTGWTRSSPTRNAPQKHVQRAEIALLSGDATVTAASRSPADEPIQAQARAVAFS
jgi:hypothetical protein